MTPASARDRRVARGLGYLLAVVAVLVGATLDGWLGASLGGLLGLAALAGLDHIASRKTRRRQALLSQAFPGLWREFLLTHSDHYRRLPEDLRGRFEAGLRTFLAERRLTGVEVEVTEDIRLLVAASAITLSVGWPDFEWAQLHEVLLYPQSFDDAYQFEAAGYAGMAHPSGTLILSVPALRESFAEPRDGYHCGYHEFAHLLDQEADLGGVDYDGIPVGLPGRAAQRWEQLRTRETERIRRGRSVLDDYGVTNAVEFFAVAVEAFFELPGELRAHHPPLYDFLAAYFCQDPARWEEVAARRGTPGPVAPEAAQSAGVGDDPGRPSGTTQGAADRSAGQLHDRTSSLVVASVQGAGRVARRGGHALALAALFALVLAAAAGPGLPTVLQWLGIMRTPSEVALPTDLVIMAPTRLIPTDAARFSGRWEGTWQAADPLGEWSRTRLAVVEITPGARAGEFEARGVYATRSRVVEWQGTIRSGWLLIERGALRLRFRVVEDGRRLQATALVPMPVADQPSALVLSQLDGTFRPLDR